MAETPPFQQLDIHAAPLDGLNLIEASAGTGKTWTITGLYARLILQEKLRVEEILVVTYTKAATAELRGRIRARLADLLQTFKHPDSNPDPFCAPLAELYSAPEEKERAVRLLNRAILGFDEAAVYTIHGFCQRILNDNAFESGMEFDCELLPDETDLIREIVDDYWRREIVPRYGLWPEFLADTGQSPDAWLSEITPHVGKPFLKVLPIECGDDEPLERSFAAAFERCKTRWQQEREDIGRLLLESNALNGNKYRSASVRAWLASLDNYFAAAPGTDLPPKFEKFTPGELQAACKKGKTPPEHPFFDACAVLLRRSEEIKELFSKRLGATKVRLLAHCNEELPRRKQRRQLLSYHDLLNRLADALTAEHGGHLAEAIRARYRAALIDEFQDTDPVQYAIFEHIYGNGIAPVFFVGDPKQAIYAFRGADIYSYLRAHDAARRHYTLETNQRSVPELIGAVNALFGANVNPFLFRQIHYPPVAAAEKPRPLLQVKGDTAEPLRFMELPAREDGKALNKGDAGDYAVEAVACEIVDLLNLAATGGARIEGAGKARPLNGGDVAVLTFTHRQARAIEEALAARNVPSVRQGQDNVFCSREALELERVLQAVAEPGRESLVKGALISELLGLDAASLANMEADESVWEHKLEDFRRYRDLWVGKGFMAMFRSWFAEYRVAERLLAYRDGERRLTNLRHLAERLQAESRDKPGCETLLGWFARAVHAPRLDDEEALLRLESDAERVKIVTIHTSKGLEYPIVFCPFLWDGALWRQGETAVDFHDPGDADRACLDLGTADIDHHRALASKEKLAEKLRLLYVALTRAKHRCYVVWGNVKAKNDGGMETAALSWLLHGASCDQEDPLTALHQATRNLNAEAIAADIDALIARAPGNVRRDPIVLHDRRHRPRARETGPLATLAFRRGALRPNWRMTSFTGLAAGRHSETPDYDSIDLPREEAPPGDTIFTFPRGSRPGTCLHAIFEEWPFDVADDGALAELVERKLKAHNLDPKWRDVVTAMVHRTLTTPLDETGLTLFGIGADRRRAELEFTYPLSDVSAARLQQLLTVPGSGLPASFGGAARQLNFEQVKGYMKGFIDLVFEADGRFYLVDYKSNWLGNHPEDYSRSRLEQAVARDHYYLQYLIYTIALHRFLEQRLPDYDYERHFGGVFYLFLRGITANLPGAGIYFDRPNRVLVERLNALLQGAEGNP